MTQCEKILKYIERHGSITTWDAFRDLGITRLSGRIHDLTQKGYDFERKTETAKNRDGESVSYTRYALKDNTQDGNRNSD